jgi:hypothetical protein
VATPKIPLLLNNAIPQAPSGGPEPHGVPRSDATVAVTVSTTLELRAGERFLRVAHELDNRARTMIKIENGKWVLAK